MTTTNTEVIEVPKLMGSNLEQVVNKTNQVLRRGFKPRDLLEIGRVNPSYLQFTMSMEDVSALNSPTISLIRDMLNYHSFFTGSIFGYNFLQSAGRLPTVNDDSVHELIRELDSIADGNFRWYITTHSLDLRGKKESEPPIGKIIPGKDPYFINGIVRMTDLFPRLRQGNDSFSFISGAVVGRRLLEIQADYNKQRAGYAAQRSPTTIQ